MTISRALRPVLAASLIAGSALGLAACGSADTTSTATSARSASADTSCPEQGSEAQYFTFMNDLTTDVTLEVPRSSWACDGYSGVSTPGNLSGRVIGHPGPQPRIRMETSFNQRTYGDTKFTLSFKASGATLVTADLSAFLYIGPTFPWGIKVDGRYRCYKPVVEFKDPSGVPAYLTMGGNNCNRSASGDVVIHLTRIKP